jgi:hypothetical protein
MAKTFKQIREDWKRAALVGGATVVGSALAGIGGFGLGLGGAAVGAGIGAAYYAASGNLRQDLRHRGVKKRVIRRIA